MAFTIYLRTPAGHLQLLNGANNTMNTQTIEEKAGAPSVRDLIGKTIEEISALMRRAQCSRTKAIIQGDRGGYSCAEQTICNLRFTAFNHLGYRGRISGDVA